MIVCDKEDFTTTNYGFSFMLLIYIVFPRYFYCISIVFLLYFSFSPTTFVSKRFKDRNFV